MQTSQAGIFALSVVLPIIASLVVLLRFFIRRKNRIGSDDWTILVALGLAWGMAEILVVGVANNSIGTHIPVDPATGEEVFTDESLQATITIIKLLFASYLILIPCLSLIKLSVLLLYRRIFVSSRFRFYSLSLCILTLLWFLGFFLATIFQCGTQPAYWWTSQETSKYDCIDTNKLELALALTDVIVDLLILGIPVPLVWKLHLPAFQRVAIIFTFLLGLLSVAGGLTRTGILITTTLETTEDSRDVLGVTSNVIVWSFVEVEVAIIAACLPTLRPLALAANSSLLALSQSVRSFLIPRYKNSQHLGDSDSRSGEQPVLRSAYELPLHPSKTDEAPNLSLPYSRTDSIHLGV